MKIEKKLAINSLKKYKKRYLYIIISIILCSFLLFTAMLVISSIRTGINEAIDKEYSGYSGYHVEMENAPIEYIDVIDKKEYVKEIYVQIDNKKIEELENIDESELENAGQINIYIKFTNAKNIFANMNDILDTLKPDIKYLIVSVSFNHEVLELYGLINVHLANGLNDTAVCTANANLDYIINFFIVLVLIIFLIIFLIILYSNFYVTMNERKKEYAVLNSIGATESQLLKIAIIEGIVIGAIGIIIGIIMSILGANIILNLLNNIVKSTIYNFELEIKLIYFIILIILVFYNIFTSITISLTKINGISAINNNKKIKRKNSVFQRFFSIEGKLALKNLKRNKSKYLILTILLIVCMTGFTCISTYIEYETEIADIAVKEDFDVLFTVASDDEIDYKLIIENYEKESGEKLEYIEYREKRYYMQTLGIINPQEGIYTDVLNNGKDDTYSVFSLENDNIYVRVEVIGLEDDLYNDYLEEINGNYGDIIFYNAYSSYNDSTRKYEPEKVFDENYDIESIQIIDNNTMEIIHLFEGNFIITDEYCDFFKDLSCYEPIIYVNMDTFLEYRENNNNYWIKTAEHKKYNQIDDEYYIRLRCDDVIDFSNYIRKIEEEQGIEVSVAYFTLEQQTLIIYIKILQLISKIVLTALILISVISEINIINASLQERKEEFKILDRVGATSRNINKTIIYESIFVFMKALIISIILSILVIYLIIKYIGIMYEMDSLLVPFLKIGLFCLMLFVILMAVTLFSSRGIKEK